MWNYDEPSQGTDCEIGAQTQHRKDERNAQLVSRQAVVYRRPRS
jgi:hypothetical protein